MHHFKTHLMYESVLVRKCFVTAQYFKCDLLCLCNCKMKNNLSANVNYSDSRNHNYTFLKIISHLTPTAAHKCSHPAFNVTPVFMGSFISTISTGC